MDFITSGEYKNYLARMFRFDLEEAWQIIVAAVVLSLLLYLITEWRHLKLWGFMTCILIGIYMGCVAGVTLFNRAPTGEYQISMDLFWSYKEYFATGETMRLVEIVCNIVMFFPFGFLIPMTYRWMRNFFLFLLYDIAFTAFIECMQLYTTRGLFELDDLFNNALGGVLGFIVFYILYAFTRLFAWDDR